VVFGLPVLPLCSYYVVGEGGGSVQGVEIPLRWVSVFAAYGRWFGWFGAPLAGFMARDLDRARRASVYAETRDRYDSTNWWIACAVLGAIAVLATFLIGRLSKRERLRRRTLRTVTGMGAPARMLPPELVERKAAELLAHWNAISQGRSWEAAIEHDRADALLLALAEFHRRPDLAARVLDRLDPAR
jgi:hypothetical protein